MKSLHFLTRSGKMTKTTNPEAGSLRLSSEQAIAAHRLPQAKRVRWFLGGGKIAATGRKSGSKKWAAVK